MPEMKRALADLFEVHMKIRSIFNFFAKATAAATLLFAIILATSGSAEAQSSRITITKDFCASIGDSNTCNGIPASFPSLVRFTVQTGTYDVATGIFTVSGNSPDVDVAIQQNANGSTTADATFTPDTWVRVCEIVPNLWNSIPRPESSGGGSSQYADGNCLIVRLGPGNNSLKFINGPGGTTAGEATLNGRVRTGKGGGVSKAHVILTVGSTGEVRRALTNPFGYYSFDGLDLNEIYIIQVSHKRYRFSEPQRTITLMDSAVDIDFVAQP